MKGYVNGWLVVVFLLVAAADAAYMITNNRAANRVVREVFNSPNESIGVRADGVVVWKAGYENGKLVDFISYTDKNGEVK